MYFHNYPLTQSDNTFLPTSDYQYKRKVLQTFSYVYSWVLHRHSDYSYNYTAIRMSILRPHSEDIVLRLQATVVILEENLSNLSRETMYQLKTPIFYNFFLGIIGIASQAVTNISFALAHQ